MNPVDLLQFLHGLLGRSPNQSEVTFAQSIHKTIAQLVFNHKSSQTNQELNHSTTSNPVPIITEACNNALKLLLQKGRLPSELQVVSFSQLLKESDALSSRPSTKNITYDTDHMDRLFSSLCYDKLTNSFAFAVFQPSWL